MVLYVVRTTVSSVTSQRAQHSRASTGVEAVGDPFAGGRGGSGEATTTRWHDTGLFER